MCLEELKLFWVLVVHNRKCVNGLCVSVRKKESSEWG